MYLYLIAAFAAVICASLVALTAYMARRSERARLSSSYQTRLDQLQRRLNAQEDLLHLVTDGFPGAMTIFDHNHTYWFINQNAAKGLGADVRDIVGKSPAKFIGREAAKKLEARLTEVRTSARPIDTMEQATDPNGRVRFMQTHYEPVAPFGGFAGGVLLREEDLTSLIVERERRENMLRQVIETLMAVIDRRDPYAAGHSIRVGQLSRAVAEEMLLDEKGIEAAEIAGALMNFGKVLVPREILTKTTPLSPDELQRVRESILTSADILSIIDFVGPVVPTLRQVLERFDGSGAPEGLKGDKILVTARIVAAANAYVALVSSRAHRARLELDDALEQMKKDGGKAFDPKVVEALGNYIKNRSAKLDWLTRTKSS